ncbi:MAG: hypothetical protein WCV90_02145 [Candidatus Woesearchaeota archaeon]|jgi:hypothetical protein
MADKDVQKVKIKGALWNFRNFLGIIKDILTIILLLVLIGGAITLMTVVPNLLQTLNTLPGLIGTMQNGGPEALMQEFQNDVNSGNWDGALQKIEAFETASGMMGLPPETKQALQELKSAVQAHDKSKVDLILSQMDSKESSSQNYNVQQQVNVNGGR